MRKQLKKKKGDQGNQVCQGRVVKENRSDEIKRKCFLCCFN